MQRIALGRSYNVLQVSNPDQVDRLGKLGVMVYGIMLVYVMTAVII